MHVNSGVDVGLGWIKQFTKMHCNAREFSGRGRSALSHKTSIKCTAIHVNSGGGVWRNVEHANTSKLYLEQIRDMHYGG